jgi:hypothetical protein
MPRYSLVWKTREKQFLKPNHEIHLHQERRNASRARRRARPRRLPPYVPHPLRARTPRHRFDRWSLHSADEHPCVPSVASGGARWRESAGRRTARGVPLAAGAAHVTGDALDLLTRPSGTGMILPTPTDLPVRL